MYVHLNVRPHIDSLNAVLAAADQDVATITQDPKGLHKYSDTLSLAFRTLCAEVRCHEYGFGFLNLLGQAWHRFMTYDFRIRSEFNSGPKSTAGLAEFLRELTDENKLKERTRLLELAGTLAVDATAYANEEIKAMCSAKLAESGILAAA